MGHTCSGILSGNAFIVSCACFQNLLKSNLDNESAKVFFFDSTYSTLSCLLYLMLLSAINLIIFMHCVDLDTIPFIMSFSPVLSQKIITDVLDRIEFSCYVNSAMYTAASSKKSILDC